MILTEIPRRLADRWAWPISKPVPIAAPPPKPERPIPTADHAELEALLGAIPNSELTSLDYDRWRNVIFAIHHATDGSDDGLALAHEFSARSPKYDPDFLETRVWPYITSDRDNAVTIETLRFMVREAQDPADDFEDLGPLPTPEEEGAEVVADGLPTRFRVLDEAAVIERLRPRWLVKNVIPEAELVVIYGQSTAGKSFIALDLFAAVARGVPWRGLKTRLARVIYLAAEGQGGFRNRLEAYRQHHGAPSGLRMILDAPNFLKRDAELVAKQIVAAGGADVIVVDTLAQVSPGGDENSAEDMGRVLLSCRRLRAETGALIVLIHHAGKDLTKGARGWSGLKAAADAEIEVNRIESQRWVKVSKSKDGEDGAEYPFKLVPVLLGQDEDGDDITSCVVDHTARVDSAMGRHEPKGKVERMVWRLAHELAEIGDGELAVDTLIAEAVRKIPRDETQRDRRREIVRRALVSLSEAEFIDINDNKMRVRGGDEEGNS